MKEETNMSTMLQALIREGRGAKLAPWLLAGSVVLYFAGYVDSSVHGAALGSPAISVSYTHLTLPTNREV